MNYGWKGTIEEFLQLSESVFVQTLTTMKAIEKYILELKE